jgi:hypothetical protein
MFDFFTGTYDPEDPNFFDWYYQHALSESVTRDSAASEEIVERAMKIHAEMLQAIVEPNNRDLGPTTSGIAAMSALQHGVSVEAIVQAIVQHNVDHLDSQIRLDDPSSVLIQALRFAGLKGQPIVENVAHASDADLSNDYTIPGNLESLVETEGALAADVDFLQGSGANLEYVSPADAETRIADSERAIEVAQKERAAAVSALEARKAFKALVDIEVAMLEITLPQTRTDLTYEEGTRYIMDNFMNTTDTPAKPETVTHLYNFLNGLLMRGVSAKDLVGVLGQFPPAYLPSKNSIEVRALLLAATLVQDKNKLQ